jgi:hypothetical protein
MQILDLSCTTELLQLLNRADADNLFSIIRNPKGNGISPEPIPGEAPILSILKPAVEAPLLNLFRHPISLAVVLDHILLDGSYLDKPGVDCSVHERSIASPAERILMLESRFHKQSATLFELLLDGLISVFEVHFGVLANLLGEFAVGVHWKDWVVGLDDFLFNAEFVIVMTEARSAVHNACTSISSHKISSQDSEAAIAPPTLEKVEQWLVLSPFKIRSLDLFNDLVSLGIFVQVGNSAFGHDVYVVPLDVLELEIDEVGVYCKCEI